MERGQDEIGGTAGAERVGTKASSAIRARTEASGHKSAGPSASRRPARGVGRAAGSGRARS